MLREISRHDQSGSRAATSATRSKPLELVESSRPPPSPPLSRFHPAGLHPISPPPDHPITIASHQVNKRRHTRRTRENASRPAGLNDQSAALDQVKVLPHKSRSMMQMRRAAVVLACLAVTAAALADGALIPWFGGGGRRGRSDDAASAAVSPLSDVGLLADDPFRILEQIPFGFDREDVAMVTMARVDWRETPDAHEIVVDVPGMRKEDLKIEVEENGRVLRISGERRREKVEERKGDHWHREERSYGRFWRQFRLPDNADLDAVNASLDNGVLTVRLRKLAPDQIKGPRVVGIASGGDSDGAEKKSIGAGTEATEPQAKKVEL